MANLFGALLWILPRCTSFYSLFCCYIYRCYIQCKFLTNCWSIDPISDRGSRSRSGGNWSWVFLKMGKRQIVVYEGTTQNANSENGKKRSGSACWNSQTVAIFCDLCIKEVENGQRPGTHFTQTGWTSLIQNFEKETGNAYDRSQLKNKWDSLKKEWKLWKELIGKETGLGWNPTKNTVDASDEWWNDKIKNNEKYAKLRKEGINPDMEAKLDIMFKGAVATGKYAWAPSSDLPPPQNGGSSTDDFISVDSDESEESNLNDTIESNQTSKQGSKRKNYQLHTLKGKKGKVGDGGKKVGGAAKMSQQIDRLVEVCEKRAGKGSQSTSITEVMKIVEDLPGIEIGCPLYWFATKLFCSQQKREMFLVMKNPEMKLQFLLRHQDDTN